MLISDWFFTEALASKLPAAVQIMKEYHPNSGFLERGCFHHVQGNRNISSIVKLE
jgi:hypothetical protein